MPVTVLAAGDHFVLPSLLADAVRAEVPDELDVRELTLPWPLVPFGPVAEVDEASGDEDTMIQALSGVRVCLTEMGPLTERMLDACPDLELFCVSRGGPVNANVAAATGHGVAVSYAPGRNAAATAEHTVSMVLAVTRRVPELHGELRRGHWRGDHYTYDNSGIELEGATVGLVGFGAVGRRVARIVRAFGAQVVVHDPYVPADAVAGAAEPVPLDELLARSRVVSLHSRLTDETRRMIGRAQLAAMVPGSVLVNCARGGLVDYDAVCDALEDGHLFGAGFDVFPDEPIPAGSRLLRAPNVVVTPHVAGASRETAHKAARIVAGEVGRFLRGEPLAHCANPEVLERRRG
ncbi:MAG: 2-hydroxyacid dehydrogenase [Streptosporangiales bacterium]|nr:2-hydroxyacid dehydrogenase [Streptosporangiales bacterium]MBO0890255.1 2-hydroxyacid dehydrogenase [Acidothermales bacterium]